MTATPSSIEVRSGGSVAFALVALWVLPLAVFGSFVGAMLQRGDVVAAVIGAVLGIGVLALATRGAYRQRLVVDEHGVGVRHYVGRERRIGWDEITGFGVEVEEGTSGVAYVLVYTNRRKRPYHPRASSELDEPTRTTLAAVLDHYSRRYGLRNEVTADKLSY